MTSCPTHDALLQLAEGTLGESVAGPLRRHLDSCPDCLAVIVALASSHDQHREIPTCSWPQAGDLFSERYRIERRIGAGASAVVFAATDTELEREVALKIFGTIERGSDAAQRIARESRAMAKLRHANVVTVFDAGMTPEHAWVAMELVDGSDLRTWLRQRSPTAPAILAAFCQAARGLLAAHEAGIVHRDFKPDNVLIDEHGAVFVGDFGLAALGSSTVVGTDQGALQSLSGTLTRSGAVLGTPAYLSAEAWRGDRVDHRSDIFALCVSMYEALHGVRPFAGDTVDALCDAVTSDAVRPARRPKGVSRSLQRMITAGLSADAERRPSLAAFIAALEATPSPVTVAVSVLGVGALVAIAAAAIPTDDASAPDHHPACLASASVTHVASPSDSLDAQARDAAQQTIVQFSDDWSAARERICATVTSTQPVWDDVDLRLRCLDIRASIFSQQAQELNPEAGPRTLEPYVEALKRCEDPNLAQLWPLPNDATRDAIAAVWGELDSFEARQFTLPAATARAQLDTLIERSRGHGPLLAQAQLTLGSWLTVAGDLEEAHQVLLEAANTAVAASFDACAAEAWNALTYIAIEHSRDLERAQEYSGYSLSAIARIEQLAHAQELRAKALYYKGLLHVRRQQWPDAEAAIEDGIALAEQAAPDLQPSFDDLRALIRSELGDPDGAVVLARRAQATRRRLLGPDDPILAFGHQLIAGLEAERGEMDTVLQELRAARTLLVRVFGTPNAQVSAAWQQEALALAALTRHDETLAALDQAEASQPLADRSDEWRVMQLSARNEVALSRGDADAERVARAYLEATRRVDPKATGERWLAEAAVQRALLLAGEAERAVELADRWLAVDPTTLDLPRNERSTCGYTAGQVYNAVERFEDAEVVLRAALTGGEQGSSDDSRSGLLEWELAVAVHGRGETDAATALLGVALEKLQTLEETETEQAQLRAWAQAAGVPLP